jgi:hypothetical protein
MPRKTKKTSDERSPVSAPARASGVPNAVVAPMAAAAPLAPARRPAPASAGSDILALTSKQKRVCERIINVFETGTVIGRYGAISIFEDGPNDIRQVTYGRSQTTEYGNLRELVQMYVDAGGRLSAELRAFVPLIGRTPLVDNARFKQLLRDAGEDPVMRMTQDEFFDRRYYRPAMKWARENGFKLGLSALVIYDSYIHSGGILDLLRTRFPERPPARGGDEKRWIDQYVEARHQWLATHSRQILRRTIYRTRCFKSEIARGNWDLDSLPIMANGTPVGDIPGADLTPEMLAEAEAVRGTDLLPFLGVPDGYSDGSEGATEPQELFEEQGEGANAAGGELLGVGASYVQKLADTAKGQYDQFHEFSEDDPPLRRQIRRYWEENGLTFPGVGTAWSAVFVSWCVRTAGAVPGEFRFSQRHSAFVHWAIANATAGRGLFRGRRITEYAPKVGDIIQHNRNGGTKTYDQAARDDSYESHSAIVVAVGADANGRFAMTIGGNESDAVRRKRVALTSQGRVQQRESNPFICVIETLKA